MSKATEKHNPCKHRRRESINGCTMDMCYAIGFERVGDMPCEYCSDWPKDKTADKITSKANQKGKTKC